MVELTLSFALCVVVVVLGRIAFTIFFKNKLNKIWHLIKVYHQMTRGSFRECLKYVMLYTMSGQSMSST